MTLVLEQNSKYAKSYQFLKTTIIPGGNMPGRNFFFFNEYRTMVNLTFERSILEIQNIEMVGIGAILYFLQQHKHDSCGHTHK
jgi:hypothetical protein